MWRNLTPTSKKIVVTILFLLPALYFIIPAARTLHYIVTNGEEIENFQPYTAEQCKKDFADYQLR